MTYFDTAYVLKCYVAEQGSREVQALARSRGRLACSVYGRLRELLAGTATPRRTAPRRRLPYRQSRRERLH